MLALASQRKSTSLVNRMYFSMFAHARREHRSDS